MSDYQDNQVNENQHAPASRPPLWQQEELILGKDAAAEDTVKRSNNSQRFAPTRPTVFGLFTPPETTNTTTSTGTTNAGSNTTSTGTNPATTAQIPPTVSQDHGSTTLNPASLPFYDSQLPLKDSTTGSSPPKARHQRTVSWGRLEERSPSSKPDKPVLRSISDVIQDLKQDQHQQRVTMEDVLQHRPVESEAHAELVRQWENRETTNSSTQNVVQLTDDAAAAFLQLPPAHEMNQSSRVDDEDEELLSAPSRARAYSQDIRRSPPPKSHRRTETMEAKLSDLCTQLNQIHLIHPADDNVTPFQRDRIDTLESMQLNTGSSSAEALNQNAGFLYHRNVSKKEEDFPSTVMPEENNSIDSSVLSGGAGQDAPSSKSASERWRKVREAHLNHRVLDEGVSRPTLDPKKTDEPIPEVDEDEYKSDVETGNVGGRQNGASGRHRFKTKEPVLFQEWKEFYSFKQRSFRLAARILFLYMIIPLIGIAAILFYLADNTPTGVLANNGLPINGTLFVKHSDGSLEEFTKQDLASASYWILYVVRQILTLSLAKLVEFLFIDFLSIRTGRTVKYCGPWVTLFILQSRGWPFLIFVWGLLDFGLLTGARPFFAHWGFWQNAVDLFNRSNPGGTIVISSWNSRILAVAICVGVVVAIKRFWMGLYLGRKTFSVFSEQLATLMRKIILISKVASLAKDIERKRLGDFGYEPKSPSMYGIGRDHLDSMFGNTMDDMSNTNTSNPRSHTVDDQDETVLIIDPNERHPLTGSLLPHQKAKVQRLLGAWEEPTVAEQQNGPISVDALLQFRRALACLKTDFPFSGSFGLCDKRESCVERAQETYFRLMLRDTEAKFLNFETIAVLGLASGGNRDVNRETIKDLIRLFRPGRDGSLTLLDFVKAIDNVYKDIRMLRASVSNATKIDHSFEMIFNILFYAIVFTVVLSQLGFDPLALFLSVSGVVLAFAFMISSASSKYFEGILFVLVRRPYQIGDGIHVSNVENQTDIAGSGWWTVTDVSLFSTSVEYVFTGERATYANGSLANSRIINSTRSPNATLITFVKLPVNIDSATLNMFQMQLKDYMHNRPREWLTYICFRLCAVDVERGYCEFAIVGQSRYSWAQWGEIHESKAQLLGFTLELQQKMGVYFRRPPLPVDVNSSGLPTNPYEFPADRPRIPSIGSSAQTEGSESDMDFLNRLTALQEQYMPRD